MPDTSLISHPYSNGYTRCYMVVGRVPRYVDRSVGLLNYHPHPEENGFCPLDVKEVRLGRNVAFGLILVIVSTLAALLLWGYVLHYPLPFAVFVVGLSVALNHLPRPLIGEELREFIAARLFGMPVRARMYVEVAIERGRVTRE